MSTYVIKLLKHRGRSISLRSDISLEWRHLATLISVENVDLPVELNSNSYVQENLKYNTLAWFGGIRKTGEALRPKKLFW